MAHHWPLVVTFVLVPFINCNKLITILSDFTYDKDLEFFKNTFPWIVDNAASNIKFDFYFRDSGKKSGKRMCILSQLIKNPYLQAEYLKCEAKGDEECTKTLPIDIRQLNICIRLKVTSFVKKADREFQKYNLEMTPVMILPRRQVITDVTPENILKSICRLYSSRKPPLGCRKPTPIPNPEEKSKPAVEPKPEEKPKLEIELKPNEKPKSEVDPKPDKKPKTEVESKQKEKPKLEEKPKSEEISKSEVEPKLQEKPKLEAESKPEEKSKPELKPKPQENTKPETDSKLEQNTKAEEKPMPENPGTEENSNLEPEEKIKSEGTNIEEQSKVEDPNSD